MKKRIFASMAVTLVMAAALATAAPAANLNKTTINVTVGSSVKVKIKGAKTANWSVKDTGIATVSAKSGKKVTVTGVKAGSTKLEAEVNGKTFKADIKVAEKAAPAAPATTTSKLQEFANYVKSKGKLTYGDVVKVKDNYELKYNTSGAWTVLPFPATGIGYEKNQSKILLFKKGKDVQNSFEITADANNLYFKGTNNFEEIDVRYVNTDPAKPYTDADKQILNGTYKNYREKPVEFAKAVDVVDQAIEWGFFRDNAGNYTYKKSDIDNLNWLYDNETETFVYQLLTDKRYSVFGSIKDISSMTVTIPLNGNAATAKFAHNTDVDFRLGANKSNAFYSEYTYQFNIANYNPEGAYGWTLTTNTKNNLQDGHDYIDALQTSEIWDMLYGNYYFLETNDNKLRFSQKYDGALVTPSLMCSYMLSGLLNTVDAMMVDQKTGFDLKAIGFNAYTNLDRHLYSNTMLVTRALYNARWNNIFFF